MFTAAGMRCFVDSQAIGAGDGWVHKLQQGIRDSAVVVVLLSGAALQSQWVMMELGAAWALDKPTVLGELHAGAVESANLVVKNIQALPIMTMAQRGELVEVVGRKVERGRFQGKVYR